MVEQCRITTTTTWHSATCIYLGLSSTINWSNVNRYSKMGTGGSSYWTLVVILLTAIGIVKVYIIEFLLCYSIRCSNLNELPVCILLFVRCNRVKSYSYFVARRGYPVCGTRIYTLIKFKSIFLIYPQTCAREISMHNA